MSLNIPKVVYTRHVRGCKNFFMYDSEFSSQKDLSEFAMAIRSLGKAFMLQTGNICTV